MDRKKPEWPLLGWQERLYERHYNALGKHGNKATKKEKQKPISRIRQRRLVVEQLGMFNLKADEVARAYTLCHGPERIGSESIHEWEMRMLDLLGPADCKFIIRQRCGSIKGMYMMKGHGEGWFFHPKPKEAAHMNWCETAVRCTNNRTLEAMRIISETEAITSKGEIISLLT